MKQQASGERKLRVAVVGATGNIGTSVLRSLARDERVASVVGMSRRRPSEEALAGARWLPVDIGDERCVPHLRAAFEGIDAVVDLAWLFHPSRDPAVTWRTNVLGRARVLEAVAAAGVSAVIESSSVGAYSPGPKDRAVDESWPTHGWPRSAYCREKAYVERLLDVFEARNPSVRVVRLRPGIVVKRESAAQQRRLFAGPLLPGGLPSRTPVIPDVPALRLQVVHTHDVADAFRRAVVTPVAGAFNIAADPVIDTPALAELLGARLVRVPWRAVVAAATAAWWLRLVPAPPGMAEAAMEFPVMDTGRARTELGWRPQYSAVEAVAEVLAGLAEGAGAPTPPLAARHRGGRLGELATGVGRRA
jgi:nucleoside-diphosphate-sugar epimerase